MKLKFGQVALFTCLATVAQAATVVIDPFTTNQQVNISSAAVGNPQFAGSGVAATFAIGGNRRIDISRTVGADGVGADVNINTPGAFAYNSDPGNGGPFQLMWDGGTDGILNETGLGSQDLTGGGTNNLLRIGFQYDLTLTLTITVYTDAANFSTASFTFSGPNGFLGGYNTQDILFSSFVPTGAGANFANVGAITINGNSALNPGADFRFDFIEATGNGNIPEPGTFAMLGGALLAVAAIRRKKA